MGVINVEGLGRVEIAGTSPTPEETAAIKARLADLKGNPPRSLWKEIPLQVAGGVRDAAQNLLNTVGNKPAGDPYNPMYFRSPIDVGRIAGRGLRDMVIGPGEPFKPITLPEVPSAETMTGGIVRGVSQFLIPFTAALKTVGLGQGALQGFARMEGISLLTEQSVFDPFDERLSNLFEQFPMLQNPITAYLKAEPDDTEAEARMKMALESAGLGVLGASLSASVKGLKYLKRGKTKEAMEAIAKAREALPAIDEAPPPQAYLGSDARIRDFAVNINLKNASNSNELKNVLQVTADAFEGRIEEARRGIVTDEQVRQLAQETGLTVDELLSRQKGEAWNAERILAARQMLNSSAKNLLDAAKKAAGTGAEADLLAYKDAVALHLGVQEQVSGLAAEAGRALRQYTQMAGGDLTDLFARIGNPKTLREQATLLSQLDDVGSLTAAAKALDEPTLTDKALEVWINFLLSGPQTHVVNALSNTLTGLWSLPEHFLAAGIGAVRRTPDRETFGEVASRAFGWLQGSKEGFSLAKKAFLSEQPSDLFSKLDTGADRAIGGRVGEFVRLPGRALVTADEFFKSIGYRMELNAQAYRSALDAGLSPRTREFAEHMQKIIADPPQELKEAAIDNARYLTFTKPLEGVSKHILAAEREIPMLRVVMPFVRTPTNIVRYAGERTPFGLFMRETKNATGADLDRQIAKMALGSMAGASVAALAAQGKVTGSGPSDPVAMSILRETGWQPYSFVFDQPDGSKKYVAYNRVEPLGILFGLSADFAQIAGEMDEEERDSIAAMISASIAQNLTDKTFFSGLSDVIEAANDPERFMGAYLRNLAGTAVPTGVAQVTRTVDPVLRDTRTALDRIKSRIPGYSEDVPARLNLWGEPIILSGGLGPDLVSPLYSSHSKFDAATNELVRLELYPRLPQRTLEGEEIPQEEYWTYVRNAGRLAHPQVTALVTSPQWHTLDKLPETQRSIIRQVIDENREVARTVLRFRLGKPLNRQQQEIIDQMVPQTDSKPRLRTGGRF